MFERFKRGLHTWTAPTAVAASGVPIVKRTMEISGAALATVIGDGVTPQKAFVVPARPPFVNAEMAMDRSGSGLNEIYNWAAGGAFAEGLGFLGYPYLAELSQRPEYRRISEIIAGEATRKWIKLSGADEGKLKELEDELNRFDIKTKFRELCEQDGFFGRAQLFIDMGHQPNDEELSKPLMLKAAKIGKGKVRGFKVIEPLWSYPGVYDSVSPLDPDFYRPKYWYVMSSIVHSDRLLTLVGREMPDLLKPAYSFGGLSMSQMAKPYVDNWLRTRQSVSDLIHSFSTMVLATDMSTILQGGKADGLIGRIQLHNQTRDNRGLMAIDKATEELTNISTPLGSLDKLQAQAQEQMSSVSGIPLVILLGVTPSGLNASSDGEIKTFYASIRAYQERVFRAPLEKVINILQLNLWGAVDEAIVFDFLDLWEMDETAKAANRKSDADMDCLYVGAGVVSPEEVRDRIVNDEENPYFGIDLSAPAPELPDDEELLDANGEPKDKPSAGDDDDDPPAQDRAAFSAAGVICTTGGKVLLLKRSEDAGAHPGEWGFPGGSIEDGETVARAAWRELHEETGLFAVGLPGAPFSTHGSFAAWHLPLDEEFEPTINGEHDEWGWFDYDALPTPRHPGITGMIAMLPKQG